MRSRKDIELDIENHREEIYKLKHALGWFTFATCIFWLAVIIYIITSVVLPPLIIRTLQPVIGSVSNFCLILSIIIAIIMIATYFRIIPFNIRVFSYLHDLRYKKRTLARLLRQLKNLDRQG